MPIELVIFDLGRVLIRICDGWQHACEVAGGPRPADIDADRQAKLHEVVCDAEVGKIDLHGFATRAAPVLGVPREHVMALSNAYLLGPYPGAFELLDELTAAGVKTACLSNTNMNHWRLMEDRSSPNFMAFEKLTHRFASHLVRLRKPDPEIYAHVEAKTRVVPRNILFFDDLAENIAAAIARGWRAHQVEVGPDPIAQMRKVLRQNGVAIAL